MARKTPETASNPPGAETATDGSKEAAEDMVKFRFDQHSFSPFGQGVMGETREIERANAIKLADMKIGRILG